MALPYPNPDPRTSEWDAFALKRNLEYLDTGATQQGFQRLSIQTGAVGNTAGAETTLFSYDTKANELSADGQRLFIRIWGNTSATANNKIYKIYWGGGTHLFLDNGAHNAIDWYIEGIIVRTATAEQSTIICQWYQGSIPTHIDFVTTTVDTRVANTLSFTGESPDANGVIARGFELVWMP
jgi:hypothetical protein